MHTTASITETNELVHAIPTVLLETTGYKKKIVENILRICCNSPGNVLQHLVCPNYSPKGYLTWLETKYKNMSIGEALDTAKQKLTALGARPRKSRGQEHILPVLPPSRKKHKKRSIQSQDLEILQGFIGEMGIIHHQCQVAGGPQSRPHYSAQDSAQKYECSVGTKSPLVPMGGAAESGWEQLSQDSKGLKIPKWQTRHNCGWKGAEEVTEEVNLSWQ